MCCGNRRTQFHTGISTNFAKPTQPTSSQPQIARPSGTVFENIGSTGVRVVGPVTGRRYHFNAPGSRVTVDPRDQSSLASISFLRPAAPLPPRR
jgi:hypothetical protein